VRSHHAPTTPIRRLASAPTDPPGRPHAHAKVAFLAAKVDSDKATLAIEGFCLVWQPGYARFALDLERVQKPG